MTSCDIVDKFSVQKHCRGRPHQDRTSYKTERLKIQQEGATEVTRYKDNGLAKDLCEAFLSANIPWEKIENPKVKEMLQKWTAQSMPIADTLIARLDDCYAESL